ncbi:hypothetical protein ACNHKD_03775 [Methylocystis sp. JAN1]|uniref:copper amine oxidase n=1 Tax=Methylocystis sp. JAN1 TaxID=3397211 RepID=UPI003FA30A9F
MREKLALESTKSAWDAAISDCLPQDIAFASGSGWRICVKAVTRFGLVVSHVSFRKSPDAPFVLVLSDGRFSEILVPYNKGTPRLMDLVFSSFPVLTLSADSPLRSDCPAPHVLLDDKRICREVRDYGIAVKKDAEVRRGQEVSFFAVLDADNYDYISEWIFRDDGSIVTRAGATGVKRDGPEDENGHMHNFTWRLDFDFGGADGDSACVTRHIENMNAAYSTATDRCDLIETEGGLQWNPAEFNTIVVSDSVLKNARGRRTEYELIPLRSGVARHTELFSRNDFWITRAKPDELLAVNLPDYAKGEPVAGEDIAVWYTGSLRHEDHMRDEDRDAVPVLWVGFELRPRNLFDATPFFGKDAR